MGTSDLKLNLWLKQRPRLMLCYSKADRGILIGSLLQISKHMSAYRTTYQHSSSCRFLLRWSWRGERRLNSNVSMAAPVNQKKRGEGGRVLSAVKLGLLPFWILLTKELLQFGREATARIESLPVLNQ